MRTQAYGFAIACFLPVSLLAAAQDPSIETLEFAEKIDSAVRSQLAAEGSAEVLVVLDEQLDLSFAEALRGRRAKGEAVVAALRATAERTQAPLRSLLRARGVEHQSFWVSNMIRVRGDIRVASEIASMAAVRRLAANPEIRMALPRGDEPIAAAREVGPPTPWGILRIGAPQAWASGIDGQGVVIGGQDTGYAWEHPALRAKYRGVGAAGVDHDYNWHDAIHTASGANVCGSNAPAPCDDGSHGTHTMGTMVGSESGAADATIGVAPGARWIGCRNMDRGAGTPATYAECFQWFLAPTEVGGGRPDARLAPDVINNSWGCPPSAGCIDPAVLAPIVEAVRAAGIVVVVSAGNEGPRCGSVASPPAIYDAAFSVAATASNDSIANFSSRGPVTVDGSGRHKPDIAAPGVDVISSVPGGGYSSFNGTSMAGPHVAGLVALLLQARPELSGEVDIVEQVLRETAVPLTTTEDCGATAGLVPNATFGAGRIDALAAVQSTGGVLYADGFEDGVRSTDWTYKGSSWKEKDGLLSASSGEAIAARAFGGCSLCTVAAEFDVTKGKNGFAALIAWKQGAKAFVELQLHETQNRWVLLQRHGSKTTQVTVQSPIDAARLYGVEVRFDGTHFRLSVEGQEKATLRAIAGSNPAGTVGFKASGRVSRLDRIVVR